MREENTVALPSLRQIHLNRSIATYAACSLCSHSLYNILSCSLSLFPNEAEVVHTQRRTSSEQCAAAAMVGIVNAAAATKTLCNSGTHVLILTNT